MFLLWLCRSQDNTRIKEDSVFLNSELAALFLLILYEQKDYNFKKSIKRIASLVLLTYSKNINSKFSFWQDVLIFPGNITNDKLNITGKLIRKVIWADLEWKTSMTGHMHCPFLVSFLSYPVLNLKLVQHFLLRATDTKMYSSWKSASC